MKKIFSIIFLITLLSVFGYTAPIFISKPPEQDPIFKSSAPATYVNKAGDTVNGNLTVTKQLNVSTITFTPVPVTGGSETLNIRNYPSGYGIQFSTMAKINDGSYIPVLQGLFSNVNFSDDAPYWYNQGYRGLLGINFASPQGQNFDSFRYFTYVRMGNSPYQFGAIRELINVGNGDWSLPHKAFESYVNTDSGQIGHAQFMVAGNGTPWVGSGDEDCSFRFYSLNAPNQWFLNLCKDGHLVLKNDAKITGNIYVNTLNPYSGDVLNITGANKLNLVNSGAGVYADNGYFSNIQSATTTLRTNLTTETNNRINQDNLIGQTTQQLRNDLNSVAYSTRTLLQVYSGTDYSVLENRKLYYSTSTITIPTNQTQTIVLPNDVVIENVSISKVGSNVLDCYVNNIWISSFTITNGNITSPQKLYWEAKCK